MAVVRIRSAISRIGHSDQGVNSKSETRYAPRSSTPQVKSFLDKKCVNLGAKFVGVVSAEGPNQSFSSDALIEPCEFAGSSIAKLVMKQSGGVREA